MEFYYKKMESPAGSWYIVADDDSLRGIVFRNTWREFKNRFPGIQEKESPVIRRAMKQLREYFNGRRRSFDLPLKLSGTAFQNRAWAALARIPFGQTITYKQQAVAIHSPRGARAVGRTNSLNPLCIVLPCHRVVGSNGNLTGYAGGLRAKKFLLELENPSGGTPEKK